MPAKSPEGRTYLTPEALEKFKAFLEDGSGSGSSEAGQHLAANRQEPSPGSDLTPMIAKTPLFTIPEQSEAEEEDEASEDGPGDNGKETRAAGSVAAHSHGQTECMDWWLSTQSTEWSVSVASEEQLTGEDADMALEASRWKLRCGGHGLPGRGHGRCKQQQQQQQQQHSAKHGRANCVSRRYGSQ